MDYLGVSYCVLPQEDKVNAILYGSKTSCLTIILTKWQKSWICSFIWPGCSKFCNSVHSVVALLC